MVERMDFEVKRLREKKSNYEKERERNRIQHEEEVERYCDRIDALEDELRYQRVLVEVTTGEVDQLNTSWSSRGRTFGRSWSARISRYHRNTDVRLIQRVFSDYQCYNYVRYLSQLSVSSRNPV